MGIFKQRYTTQDLTQLFVFCGFPIHVWAILNMLSDIPSWLLYMDMWEVISSVAYILSFALIETIIVFLVVLLIGMIIPKRWVAKKYVPLCSVWLVELAIMAIVFQHFVTQHLPKRNLIIGYALILALSSFIALRFPKVGEAMRFIAERLAILTFIYIVFDVIGLLIVIIRNV